MIDKELKQFVTELFNDNKKSTEELIIRELKPLSDLVLRVNNIEQTMNITQTVLKSIVNSDKKKNVIIHGIQEIANETYKDRNKAIDDLATKLDIPKIDYDETYRIGKPVAGKERPQLIKFLRTRDKTEVM